MPQITPASPPAYVVPQSTRPELGMSSRCRNPYPCDASETCDENCREIRPAVREITFGEVCPRLHCREVCKNVKMWAPPGALHSCLGNPPYFVDLKDTQNFVDRKMPQHFLKEHRCRVDATATQHMGHRLTHMVTRQASAGDN